MKKKEQKTVVTWADGTVIGEMRDSKTRTKTKATKKKMSTISFECDDATLKRLTDVSKLAGTSLSQTVSVILALYVHELKEIKGEGFDKDSPEIWTKDKKGSLKRKKISYDDTSFGLGEK